MINMNREYWITVRNHPDYEVSNLGRVRKKFNRKILTQTFNRTGGYLRVHMDGKRYYVHRVVLSSFSDMSGETSEEAYRANCMLIYQSCDIFHNKELIEAYACKEPYEVVTKIFHDNVCEVRTIADKIMKLYGYGKEKQGEKLKN